MITLSSLFGKSASLTCLTATVSPVPQFNALYTDPNAPFPRQSPNCYNTVSPQTDVRTHAHSDTQGRNVRSLLVPQHPELLSVPSHLSSCSPLLSAPPCLFPGWTAVSVGYRSRVCPMGMGRATACLPCGSRSRRGYSWNMFLELR